MCIHTSSKCVGRECPPETLKTSEENSAMVCTFANFRIILHVNISNSGHHESLEEVYLVKSSDVQISMEHPKYWTFPFIWGSSQKAWGSTIDQHLTFTSFTTVLIASLRLVSDKPSTATPARTAAFFCGTKCVNNCSYEKILLAAIDRCRQL